MSRRRMMRMFMRVPYRLKSEPAIECDKAGNKTDIKSLSKIVTHDSVVLVDGVLALANN